MDDAVARPDERLGVGDEGREPGADHHLAEDDAQREHVGPSVAQLTPRHLRRERTDPARERAYAADRRRRARSRGDAEVADLHLAVPREQHVAGGQLAVHDAEADALGRAREARAAEGLGDLAADEEGEVERKALVAAGRVRRELGEGAPLDELLEGVGLRGTGEAEVLDAKHVGVPHARRALGRAREGREHGLVLVAGDDVEDLHRHRPGHRERPAHDAAVHRGHAPPSDLAPDAYGPAIAERDVVAGGRDERSRAGHDQALSISRDGATLGCNHRTALRRPSPGDGCRAFPASCPTRRPGSWIGCDPRAGSCARV